VRGALAAAAKPPGPLIGALCAVVLAGCGAASPDLFAVERSGTGPNAKLVMVVNDGGTVTCNGHAHQLDPDHLLQARDITRQLAAPAELHLELPPAPGQESVLNYRVRLEAGTVAFSDTSQALSPALTAAQAFTKSVAEDVCGIAR
jgi:hypothetical protein